MPLQKRQAACWAAQGGSLVCRGRCRSPVAHGLGTPQSWSISCDSDIRKNPLIASVGKQCSRLLEDDTETALQKILKNK